MYYWVHAIAIYSQLLWIMATNNWQQSENTARGNKKAILWSSHVQFVYTVHLHNSSLSSETLWVHLITRPQLSPASESLDRMKRHLTSLFFSAVDVVSLQDPLLLRIKLALLKLLHLCVNWITCLAGTFSAVVPSGAGSTSSIISWRLQWLSMAPKSR